MSAAWAWLTLVVGVVIYVAIFDLLAHFGGRPTMTAQFHTWMVDPVIGPFIVGGYVAVAVGLMYHFVMHHARG